MASRYDLNDAESPFLNDPALEPYGDQLAFKLIDASPVGLLLVRKSGQVVFVNRRMRDIFGYEEKDISSLKLLDLIPHDERQNHRTAHLDYLENPVERQMGGGRVLHGLRKDGSLVPLEIGLTPIVVEGQRYVLASIIDIADRIRMLEEKQIIEIEKERLDAANQAKSTFVASMSHEIRTPLTSIIGIGQLLGVPEIEPGRKDELLRSLERNAAHLHSLVDDVLDLSRIEAGAFVVESVSFALANELEAVLSIMRPRAETKGLGLDLAYEGSIPETLDSDPKRLRQILLNLVGNAIKFTEVGSVRILVRFDDGDLVFCVRDTGRGIAEELRSELFKTFVRPDRAAARRYQGSGLGLALSRGMARQLGGDLELVKSEVGRGSLFHFRLPLPGVGGGVRMLSKFPSSLPRKKDLDILGRLKGCRILVAEDSPDIQLLCQVTLEAAGAQVVCASNGAEALDRFGEAPFDIVLMDMQMPELNGDEATRKLRAAGARIPIIAFTAGTTEEERERCLRAGFDEFRGKPVSPRELVDIVAKWI